MHHSIQSILLYTIYDQQSVVLVIHVDYYVIAQAQLATHSHLDNVSIPVFINGSAYNCLNYLSQLLSLMIVLDYILSYPIIHRFTYHKAGLYIYYTILSWNNQLQHIFTQFIDKFINTHWYRFIYIICSIIPLMCHFIMMLCHSIIIDWWLLQHLNQSNDDDSNVIHY